MADNLENLSGVRYISLETFRRDGTGVKTPVAFVIYGGKICVVTRESTGKVARLKHNAAVRIAPCTFRGKVTGGWISGKASPADENDATRIIRQRRKRYGVMAALAELFTMRKGGIITYMIEPDA